MNESHNKTYKSMLPLIWVLKAFCLNCNINAESMNSNYVCLKSFFAALIIGFLNFAGLYYKINYVYKLLDLSVQLTDFIQIIYDYLQYIVDLYFVYKYGRHICLEYFKQYEAIDNKLYVTCFSMIKLKLLKFMAFFFVIWTVSSSLDFGAWLYAYGWVIPIAHSMAFSFLFVKMLTTLDLIANVIQITVRLRIIGDLAQDCYSATNSGPDGIIADCIGNKRWLYKNYGTETHLVKVNCDTIMEVKSLTSCYLMITEQVSFINKIFGFRIMLNSLSLLIDMIKLSNIAVRIAILSPHLLNDSNYMRIISSIFHLITCAIIFITLVDQCERAYRQRERIINSMDHLLFNKYPDDDLRVAVINFRQLIQDRPIVFNMANFFSLNYPLLISLASVVVTYTIILLQIVN